MNREAEIDAVMTDIQIEQRDGGVRVFGSGRAMAGLLRTERAMNEHRRPGNAAMAAPEMRNNFNPKAMDVGN